MKLGSKYHPTVYNLRLIGIISIWDKIPKEVKSTFLLYFIVKLKGA
jgi:hypothetical protein